MALDRLDPNFASLSKEYVLIQAWKKTSSYIRSHNSFADTLALDQATVNLPEFLERIRNHLKDRGKWKNKPLRIVPAPKSQAWHISEGHWRPEETLPVPLRPLAHVNLEDQVVATALMLCLADRVETKQGDPRTAVDTLEARRKVISYGNRLFCDEIDGVLYHRWGSSKLYRSYFQDYRKFLSRPEVAIQSSTKETEGKDVYVIHSDITKFYDKVKPELLSKAIEKIQYSDDDTKFFNFLKSLLLWKWDSREKEVVQMCLGEQESAHDIILPQGLVASGFFANLVLLPFDDELRATIGRHIPGIGLCLDVCRYVDDLRIVIVVNQGRFSSLCEAKKKVFKWLQEKLKGTAPGLELSSEKTEIIKHGDKTTTQLMQGAKMQRIQKAISGGFDMTGGMEVIDAIQGLLHSQEGLKSENNELQMSVIPDVRDVTVARFAAARYRKTYRSLRTLLSDEDAELSHLSMPKFRTRTELDREARGFAIRFVQRWIDDPANIRLMRIALDLYPSAELLRRIFKLLRSCKERENAQDQPDFQEGQKRVVWYCFSEIFRAGATETGHVPSDESLPSDICLKDFQDELKQEAEKVITEKIPWYLHQQALLFLATRCSSVEMSTISRKEKLQETEHYWEIIHFLHKGESQGDSNFVKLALLARRVFLDCDDTLRLIRNHLNGTRIEEIAKRDPSFALELIENEPGYEKEISRRLQLDLFPNLWQHSGENKNLGKSVIDSHPRGDLRNELTLLYFAKAFLEQEDIPPVVTPGEITLDIKRGDGGIRKVKNLQIRPENEVNGSGSLYEPPTWCTESDRWRIQLGFLLRFILSGNPDFTQYVRSTHWKESRSVYRAASSHFYQRLYGNYSGQHAFGDDWLPITEWFEKFLHGLLAWPGCRTFAKFGWMKKGRGETIDRVKDRIKCLEKGSYGTASRTLILPLNIAPPVEMDHNRPLRTCVVQTVVPSNDDFNVEDLALNNHKFRKKHRQHLSAALAAVDRMLILRNTHKRPSQKLDWLILPELAVHPEDINAYLIPFARKHKAIILAGLTYEEVIKGEPLVNSAIWIIPEHSKAHGLQIRTRRQGKCHLAKDETLFNSNGTTLLQGFRPCQWLIGYPWSNDFNAKPLQLTASICYDATDVDFISDLRKRSDVFAVPALNKDVSTFDQMAMALHYHMFQYVVVANNGKYGGSNAYFPHNKRYHRKVFHMHGQPQATISFLDIDDIDTFLKRVDISSKNTDIKEEKSQKNELKYPPAGLNNDEANNQCR